MSDSVSTGAFASGALRPTRAPRPSPALVAAPALLYLVVASALMLQGIAPFVNSYYLSAWYPTLILIDCAIAVRTGQYYLLSRPRFALSLLGWSAVLWFFFEAMNFRIANWYYVNLPPPRSARWIGTTVSFMTVLPAIFLAERWLASRWAFERVRWAGFEVTPALLRRLFLVGVAFAALTMLWPRLFFPMVWGALTLLVEPWNYRRDPTRSLLGDLAAGRPARLLRLLAGGLAIGFIWELFNIASRSKWIYTVPGFENFKLFEMPLLGFFGFPIFALDCYVIYQALVLAGVAMAGESSSSNLVSRLNPRRTIFAAIAATAFSLAVLFGMDRWNTDSLRPRIEDLWVAEPAAMQQLEQNYIDLFQLARAAPEDVAAIADAPLNQAQGWVEAARLATFRGIGTENGRLLWDAGVTSVADLASANPAGLARRLGRMTERPRAATPSKVRVWVQAAQQVAPGISAASGQP